MKNVTVARRRTRKHQRRIWMWSDMLKTRGGLIGCDPQYVGQHTSPPSLPWSLHSFNSSTYHSVQQRWWTPTWSVVTTIFPLTTVRTSRRLRLIAGHGVLMRSSDGVMPYPEVFLQGSYLGEDLLFWERAKQSSRMIWSVLTRCGKPEASWLDRSTNSQEEPSHGHTLRHLGLRFTDPTSMGRQSETCFSF